MPRPSYDTPCKLGTVPAVVRLHGADTVEAGRIVRVQEAPGAKWEAVLVHDVSTDGHFKAERWLSDVPADRAQPPAGTYGF